MYFIRHSHLMHNKLLLALIQVNYHGMTSKLWNSADWDSKQLNLHVEPQKELFINKVSQTGIIINIGDLRRKRMLSWTNLRWTVFPMKLFPFCATTWCSTQCLNKILRTVTTKLGACHRRVMNIKSVRNFKCGWPVNIKWTLISTIITAQ